MSTTFDLIFLNSLPRIRHKIHAMEIIDCPKVCVCVSNFQHAHEMRIRSRRRFGAAKRTFSFISIKLLRACGFLSHAVQQSDTVYVETHTNCFQWDDMMEIFHILHVSAPPSRCTTRIPVSGRNIVNASCGGRCSLRLRVVSAQNTTISFGHQFVIKCFSRPVDGKNFRLIKIKRHQHAEQKRETWRKSELTANPFRSIEGKMTPFVF